MNKEFIKLVNMKKEDLKAWLKGFLLHKDPTPLDLPLTRVHPVELLTEDMSQIFRADKETFNTVEVKIKDIDTFQDNFFESIVELLEGWRAVEGIDYFNSILLVIGYYRIQSAFSKCYELFNDDSFKNYLKSEDAIEIHANLLSVSADLSGLSPVHIEDEQEKNNLGRIGKEDLAKVNKLLERCEEEFIKNPPYSALCFDLLCKEDHGRKDYVYMPYLLDAKNLRPSIEIERILYRHYERYPNNLEEPDHLAKTFEGLVTEGRSGKFSLGGKVMMEKYYSFLLFKDILCVPLTEDFSGAINDMGDKETLSVIKSNKTEEGRGLGKFLCSIDKNTLHFSWEIIKDLYKNRVAPELREMQPKKTAEFAKKKVGLGEFY